MYKTLVIGMGKSGQGAAELLCSKGVDVTGVDRNPALFQTPPLQRLKQLGVELLADTDIHRFDQVVISPGVAPSHPLCLAAQEAGVEVIGEVELAFRYCRQPVIGITGTNGKTTVTLLVEHVLKSCGVKAHALGNVGEPLSTYFLHPDLEEVLVVELSSYQLETVKTPICDVAAILNITPDHLDRYSSFEEYAQAKWLIQNCLKSDGELYVYEEIIGSRGWKTFGCQSSSNFWTDGQCGFQGGEVEYILPPLYRKMGRHDWINSLAAWILCRRWEIGKEAFSAALNSFTKPAHRIEFVAEINGVTYYDDSKGTNIDAVIQAVASMTRPLVLIAGGVDKGASYSPWKKHFHEKVKKIIVLGEAAEKIYEELGDSFCVEKVGTMEEAVALATHSTRAGDAVLLSPGCSSFDMFEDYVDRGKKFQYCVRRQR